MAGGIDRRSFNSIFLLHLLAAAEPQSSLEASLADFDLHGHCVAGIEAHFRRRSAAYGSRVVVWAVLCIGGIDFLGLCIGFDSVCGSAVQRGAVGAGEQGSGNREQGTGNGTVSVPVKWLLIGVRYIA